MRALFVSLVLLAVAPAARADSKTVCRVDSGGHRICRTVERDPPRRCTQTCRTDSGGHRVCRETCR